MTAAGGFRAWRFEDAPVDVTDLPSQPHVGGVCLTPSGGISTVDELSAVRQSIRLLLATRPGERVMRPEYGCHLHRLVFASNDASTAGLAIHYIRQAIERWEPRAIIEHIEAGSRLFDARQSSVGEDADAQLQVELRYRVRTAGTVEVIGFFFELTTGRQTSVPTMG